MTADELRAENAELRRRLEEAEETVRAIRDGDVDALVVVETDGPRVYTLEGADRPYRLLVEEMQQGAATLQADGFVVWCNRRLAELLRVPHERLVGARLSDFVAPDDRAGYADQLSRGVARTGGGEARLRPTDGGSVPAYLTFSALPKDCGAAVGVLVTDLTAQRHQERLAAAYETLRSSQARLKEQGEALHAERERLRVTLASIGDAVATTDTAGRVTFLNGVAETLTGWTSAEAAGRPLDDVFRIVNEKTRQPVESPAERALRDGVIVGLANHTVLIARDGTERPIDDSAAPIRSAAGEVVGSVLVFRDITERRRAEAAVRAAEEREAFVRRSSGVGFWYCDLPFDVLEWDERVKEHFHLPPDARVTIDTFYDRIHPDDREPTRAAIERSIAERTGYDTDYRTVDPATGATAWVRALGRTVYATDGTPTRFDGVTLDITARKRAELAVREGAERLRLLDAISEATRGATDPAVVMAETTRLLAGHLGATRCAYADLEPDNDRFTIRHDWTAPGAASAVGVYSLDLFGPRAAADMRGGRTLVVRDVDRELTPGGGADTFNAIGVKAIVCCPLVKGGRLAAMMAVHQSAPRDWTADEVALVAEVVERSWAHIERVRVAEALRESELRYRLVGQAANDAIWDWDLVTNRVVWNEGLQTRFGYTAEQVGPDAAWWAEHIHPGDRERVAHDIHAAIDGDRELWSGEYRYRRADGSYADVFDRGRVVRVDGKPVRMVGSMLDLTERKRLEDELRQVAADLSEADRRKDEFLAMLAHELRNPLAPIRNGLQILRLSKDAGEAAAAVEMMDRQMGQMVRLVDDLLDVSRVSRGKIELKRERVELAAVVRQAVEAVRSLYESRGHHMTVTLPAEPIYLNADPARVAQVVGNLLNNACKFTDDGGRIALTAERDGADAVVRVRDTGIGIAADHLPHIFDMFMQIDTSLERSVSGLGIGLTLVKNLVEMHGGTVEVRSEGVGRGSEFVVRLPVAAESPESPEPTASGPKVTTARRILVVDDNRDSAESLSQLLEITANETRVAFDGVEAVEAAAAFRPDVILMDIGLPRLNGYEAARRVREQSWGKKVVLVALTGWGQEEDRQRAREAGFDGHMVKPVDYTALTKLLAELVRSTA